MRLYRCKNGCHAANKSGRCPHCGEWLKFDGEMTPQEAHDKVLREQSERFKAAGGEDWKKRDNSRTRALKEKAKREEAKY
ncbi:MAG: hypothetical protein FJ045_04205, partial [Crenarchaeota archaeon]|nr:hypothetical protein [Thermoproteota archaeon]